MPARLLRPCTYPGCGALSTGGRCDRHTSRPEYRDPARHRLYGARWQKFRASWLSARPWCAACLRLGVYTLATEVHHLRRHGGDASLFWAGPFESLCKPCHSRETAHETLVPPTR